MIYKIIEGRVRTVPPVSLLLLTGCLLLARQSVVFFDNFQVVDHDFVFWSSVSLSLTVHFFGAYAPVEVPLCNTSATGLEKVCPDLHLFFESLPAIRIYCQR